jgi:hypothetical protein
MVAVKGFPRPLYPPDAAPAYVPSIDGSDVEGIKRTVSRAGRWKWQAFDQAFSNGFSHGKGGNVIDTGVAGVQRQGKISPPTGYVGQATFNLLRSIRIPAGLPHAGEPAMDARAVELINAAWDRFQGSEPPPPSGNPGQARLDKARTQVGVSESPANSNMTPYGAWYGANGQPWCAIFVTWCDQLGSAPCATFQRGVRYAYVPYIVSDARLGQRGLSLTSSPRPGDLVCYDWDRNGEFDHVGIFDSGNASNWYAIEGNTSNSDQSNGGQVMRRQRAASQQATLFVRVA